MQTQQWQIELCRLEVQQKADRTAEQSLLAVSPCNEKLILDLQRQGLYLSHHLHGNEHVDNVLRDGLNPTEHLVPTNQANMVMVGPHPAISQRRGIHCEESTVPTTVGRLDFLLQEWNMVRASSASSLLACSRLTK